MYKAIILTSILAAIILTLNVHCNSIKRTDDDDDLSNSVQSNGNVETNAVENADESPSDSVVQSNNSSDIESTDNCVFNSKVYANKEGILTDNPCEQCVCIDGGVLCGLKTCPPAPHEDQQCQEVRREGDCCPVYQCSTTPSTSASPPTSQAPPVSPRSTVCLVRGRKYEAGSVITTDENVSIVCRCLVEGVIQCAPKTASS